MYHFQAGLMDIKDLKWDQILRFRLIEIIAMWEGRLTTNHLRDTFKIGRQQASRDISKYKSLFAQEQLILDQKIKGYKPSKKFKPAFTQGIADEYLSFLHQQNNADNCFEFFNLGNAETVVLNVPGRNISPAVIRTLITAARDCTRVDVEYISLNSGEIKGRVITPHTLIFDGVRWHVRAHCEDRNIYIDLVLSRFRNEPELMNKSVHTRDQDHEWNDIISLTLIPNPFLSTAQQEIIAHDYDMSSAKLSLDVRAPLVKYYKKLFNVCEEEMLLKDRPKEFQLTVE